MPRTRTGKITKRISSSPTTVNIGSRHELSEATHILLRESSTQKIFTTEVCLLSSATRAKPLACGRKIAFPGGNRKGQNQGEIILVGTYEEVMIEMNNNTSINNSSEGSQSLQPSEDSIKQNHINQLESTSNSSVLLNFVEPSVTRTPSPLQPLLNQDYTASLSSPTPSAAVIMGKLTSNSLSSKHSTNVIDEIPMQNNIIDTASSITIQHLSSSSSELPSLTTKARIPNISLSLVPSTTIPRKTSSGEALREIKYLQSLVNSKDAEINKLTEQNKKLKEEVETISQFSVILPTDNVVVQWVDYLYESIHKEDIRNQIDLNTAADGFGIERESLELCLELASGDRISTARQLLKHCLNYEEVIQQEHCWQKTDEDIIIKICRFVREMFGVSLKHSDDYVRESLANMMRKDSWKARNPEKSKKKSHASSSTVSMTLSKQSEDTFDNNDCEMSDDDDENI